MCYRSSSSVILINYSCVHNQIATFGLFSRQSVTLDIGLNIGCSHHRDNRPSEQSAKCTIGQALSRMRLSTLFVMELCVCLYTLLHAMIWLVFLQGNHLFTLLGIKILKLCQLLILLFIELMMEIIL